MIKLKKCFVAYIDILGFSQYICDHCDNPDEIMDFLHKFVGDTKRFCDSSKTRITVFSDNIVISMPVEHDPEEIEFSAAYQKFLLLINNIQLHAIIDVARLPIRGAVSYGDFYHNDDGGKYENVIFGGALLETYTSESKYSIYPRIIVRPKLY